MEKRPGKKALEEHFGRIRDAIGAERVLFGSGYPRSHPAHELEKLKGVPLRADRLDLYFRLNAVRLWKIPT